jgi:uncharacterized RDD family membrane protein YckC
MASTRPARPNIGWRLLALSYDLLPVLALWMLVSALFTVGFYAAGHAARQNIPPFSLLAWLLWLTCWLLAGVYAVMSWERGGQTIGMRPWRLHLVGIDGVPARRALVMRYVVGTVSMLAGGVGIWWAWLDRDRLTWHDRASRTRIERIAKKT